MEFWAKTTCEGRPGISVFEHMVNVGCVARCLAEAAPHLLERFKVNVAEIGALSALHDLGKISPGFQRKCEHWLVENNLADIARNGCWDTNTEPDHSKVSHAAIQDFLVQQGYPGKITKYVAAAIGAHHGRLKYLPNSRGIRPPLIKPTNETSSGIDWEKERLNSCQHIWEYFQVNRSIDAITGESAAIWWLAGLTTVADWVGSDERYFPPEPGTHSKDSPVVARQALDAIGYLPPIVKQGLTFEQIFEFPPNEMQAKTLEAVTGPGVFIIEAPMGMGKTEAALGAAYQLLATGEVNGLYFALPTQATSNRMHLRINAFLQRIAPETGGSRLIHGNSWLMRDDLEYHPAANSPQRPEEEDARNGRDWFLSAKRALLAAFGVGTVDQALLGVVAAKHFFVRHFALAGKVVIIDEVHSYDIYTGTLINKLITTLEELGCTVLILSATLTARSRNRIVSSTGVAVDPENQPYPLVSGRKGGEVFYPVAASPPVPRKVLVDFAAHGQAADEALVVANKGGAVLWICNTIGEAQRQYKQFKDRAETTFPIGLLHSRFPFHRREALEAEWMERFGKEGNTRCGSILVATQIVEQSVDLDADFLVTELAPTDMLLQRLGRLWRHERANRQIPAPCVCILKEGNTLDELRKMKPKAIAESLGNKAFVYSPFILLRSLEVWEKNKIDGVSIPLQVRKLLEATYEERDVEPDSWAELWIEWTGSDSAKKIKAQMASNIWQVALNDQEGVQTRLNELETVSMVLCRDVSKQKIEFVDNTTVEIGGDVFRFSTAKAIHRNLVKVPLHHFVEVEQKVELRPYFYERYCIGIVGEDGCVTIAGLKKGLRLFYSDQMGLFIEKNANREET